jgi:hypothetical protein
MNESRGTTQEQDQQPAKEIEDLTLDHDDAVDHITGGKTCATGEHLKDVSITTR